MIQTLAGEYPVRLLCALLAVPSSSYYYHPQAGDDLSLLAAIEQILGEYPTYGYRRVTAQLQRQGESVNHKRVQRVMEQNDLLQALRPHRGTTNSRHGFPRYPNLVAGLVIDHPDQVWCADITYIQLRRQTAYLAILLDVFTRSLRGWHLGPHLDTQLALAALEQAYALHVPAIHHSDQGIQYAATGYVQCLQARHVQISMCEVGEPTQNGYAERVIRTIKEEEVYLNEYRDITDARANIGHFITDVYQTKRIHSALGYLTPLEFETQWLADHASA